MATFVNNSSDNKSKVEIRAVSITDIPTRIAKKLLLEEEKRARYDESGQAQLEHAKSIFEQNQVNSISKLREAFGWLKKSVDANCYDAHLYIMECLNSIKNSTQLKIYDFITLKIAYHEYQFMEVIDFINYYIKNTTINPPLSVGIYLFILEDCVNNVEYAMDILNMDMYRGNFTSEEYKRMDRLLFEIYSNPHCFNDYNYYKSLLFLKDNYFVIKDYYEGVEYLNLAMQKDLNTKAYNYMLSLFNDANNNDIDASIIIATLIKSNNKLIKCTSDLADHLFKYAYTKLESIKSTNISDQKKLVYLYEFGLGGKQKLKLARAISYKLSEWQRQYGLVYEHINEIIKIRREYMLKVIVVILLLILCVTYFLYN